MTFLHYIFIIITIIIVLMQQIYLQLLDATMSGSEYVNIQSSSVFISGCKQYTVSTGLLSSCGPWRRIDPLQTSSRGAGALEGLSGAPNQ